MTTSWSKSKVSGTYAEPLVTPHRHESPEREPVKHELNERERSQARRLLTVLLITLGFFCVQGLGAIWADSDVLRAEAVHLLADVGVLGLALVGMHAAVRRPTARFTFGFRRVEPVLAIVNGLLLLAVTALIVAEAIADFGSSSGPRADRMLYIAAAGLAVNGVSAWLIHGAIGGHPPGEQSEHGEPGEPAAPPAPSEAKDAADCDDHSHLHLAHAVHARGHALNLRGAWLHLLGDALGSLAALLAALAIQLGASLKVDPLATFFVAAILVYGALRLLWDALLILLEASPAHLPAGPVRDAILRTPGVLDVRHLHIWTLGAGHEAIAAHVGIGEYDPLLAIRIEEALRHRFHVEYVTIQVEPGPSQHHDPPADSAG